MNMRISSTTRSTRHVGLAAALSAVSRRDRLSDAAWPLVIAAITHEVRLRRARYDFDDVQQDVSLKLLRSNTGFVGDTDAAAVAYLRAVVRNVIIDLGRRDEVRPRAVPSREGETPLVDRVPAPDPDADTSHADGERAVEALLDRLLAETECMIERSGKHVVQRQNAWNAAQSTVLARIRGMEAESIATELGVPTASRACIHKWVERGRPLLLAALDQLATTADPAGLHAMGNLRGILVKRRQDAGKARPGTQKKRGAK